jgi:thiamine biosynthesis lipoprotein
MRETRMIMGMPITVEIAGTLSEKNAIEEVFNYFTHIDRKFSTYKPDSEISLVNRGKLKETECSDEIQEVLQLCEQTRQDTNGYFNHWHKGLLDPTGIVKGWAIQQASSLLAQKGFNNYYIEAGGDIQTAGNNIKGEKWSVGIRNPFVQEEIIKVLHLSGQGIATSGTYLRGAHIYNPHEDSDLTEFVSLTVIGKNVYEADRFATPAFAMGKKGIHFIEDKPGLEGYMINNKGIGTQTTGFNKYVRQ